MFEGESENLLNCFSVFFLSSLGFFTQVLHNDVHSACLPRTALWLVTKFNNVLAAGFAFESFCLSYC